MLPADSLARITSYNYLGAFALGPLGLAVAGPVADAIGPTRFLALGAAYQMITCAAMMALPAGRSIPGGATACVSDRDDLRQTPR